MGANRIRIAKDKGDLVRALTISNQTTAPFQTYVQVLVFAAALGARRKKRVPLVEFSRDLEPIRIEIFENNRYDVEINLLAMYETQDHHILADDDESQERRLTIFEEYANGGLEILREELRGAVDYTERILLILSAERGKQEQPEEEFDLSRFLS